MTYDVESAGDGVRVCRAVIWAGLRQQGAGGLSIVGCLAKVKIGLMGYDVDNANMARAHSALSLRA